MVVKAERKIIEKKELRGIFADFEKKLKEEKLQVKEVLLFGSYARGKANRDSDIDVAVVVSSRLNPEQKKKLSKIAWIAKQVNIKLEPHVLTTSDLKNKWLSFPAQVLKEGIKI